MLISMPSFVAKALRYRRTTSGLPRLLSSIHCRFIHATIILAIFPNWNLYSPITTPLWNYGKRVTRNQMARELDTEQNPVNPVEKRGHGRIRHGRPIAKPAPIERPRKIRPLPGYGTKIVIKGDLFSDDSALWSESSVELPH